mgnify:CR=1 FL=1
MATNKTRMTLIAALCLGSALAITGCESKTKTADTAAVTEVKSTMMEYTKAGQTDADHLWLEEVEGEKALEKVKGWNAASSPKMETETYKAMKKELLEVYNSPEKIPYISYRNGMAHNFWQDDKHVKGIWRTTTLESYTSGSPQWETVLDIDALAETDGKNWVYKGNTCLGPDYNRCMVRLSVGGKDAVERREFDVASQSFVDGGFMLPESKGGTAWIDQDNLLIGVDFGEGTMTDSGYPMIAKLWTRGTDVSDAKELMRGEKTDVGVFSGTFENDDVTAFVSLWLQPNTGQDPNPADFNFDGTTDLADWAILNRELPALGAAVATAIPEPATGSFLLLITCVCFARHGIGRRERR